MRHRVVAKTAALVSVLVSISCAVSSGQALNPAPGPSFRPDQCLPSTTLAYAEIPDFDATTARFKETAVYKIWSEPAVQEFAGPITAFVLKHLDELKNQFAAEMGLPFDELYAAFTGRIAAALMNFNPPAPPGPDGKPAKLGEDVIEIAIFLTPKDPDRVKALIEALHAYVQKKDKSTKVQQVECGGISVTEIFSEGKRAHPSMAHCWLGDTFVLTVGPTGKTMQDLIARRHGQARDLLSANESFTAVKKRVGGVPADFFFYVSAESILQKCDPYIGAEIRPALEAAGLYSLRSVSYRLAFDGPAFRDIIYLHTAPEKRGFVSVLSPSSLDEKVLDLIPADATNCAATRLNPGALWQAVDAFAKSLGEKEYADFRETIQEANDYLEVDLEKEIIPVFGDYAVLYNQPSQMGPLLFGILDWVAVVHVKDKTKAEAIGELLRQKTTELALEQAHRGGNAAVPFYWQSLPQGDATIHYVTITESPFPMLTPGYAVSGERVVVGLTLQNIQTALGRIKEGVPGIRTRPDFAMVRTKVPAGGGAILYMDVKANFPQIHAAVSGVLGFVIPMMQAEMELPIDMSKFPPAEAFTKHLFGSILTVNGEENGIAVESYSPGNLSVGIPAAAIVAAIAIPNLLRSRMAANESAAVGSLKTIAVQQAIFKQQAEIDQDKDGVGEYGLLCELCGEIPLRPRTQTKVNPIYISQQFSTGGAGGGGLAEKNGYYFRMYLPASPTTAGDDKSLGGMPQQGGPPSAANAVNFQETSFVVYAWPIEIGGAGKRTFFVNEVGEVYATDMTATMYSGEKGPGLEAAFAKKGNGADGWFNDEVGGDECNDGNEWAPVD